MHAASDIDALIELLSGKTTVALTGAGCSTESGIPDYRGPGTAARARNPMKYHQFAESELARRRYWARSLIGWPRIAAAKPNRAHLALAELEHAGVVEGLVTQNVDRLHQAAGSRRVIELHGALGQVRCLACGQGIARQVVQSRLLELNPSFADRQGALAPDGDVDVDGGENEFVLVDCDSCGGPLKPDVVFFGESVPKARVEAAFNLVGRADVLLVVGSSLTVYSGFRFVRHAASAGQAIAIVNLGPTRGDDYAALRVDRRAGDVLPVLAQSLAALARPKAGMST